MKKKFVPTLIAALLVFLNFNSGFCQLSSGGTPAGFKLAPSNRLVALSLPAINVDSLLAEDAVNEQYKGAPYRFGYNHMVNYTTHNSGHKTELRNGDRIWQLDVRAPGSYTINLAFSDFHLAPGAKLFVYSKDHSQILGGFTSANNTADNMLGTEIINGDEAVIELYEPAMVAGQSSFTLFRITQGYKDVQNYLKSFGQAGNCIHNINCPQYADFATQKRAVICLVSNGNEFCSASLVNNVLNDGTPYVLTANHCGTADGTWVFRFNWEAPGCANPATSPSTAQSITGATPIAQTAVSDFNLVRMSSPPPSSFHAFYAGWNHGLAPATSVTAIHHPSGDIKKCSRADNAVTDTFYDAGNGTALVWQIGQWTDGCTEPGSSGSPLFDQNKRIVGQLYGGPSACGALPADMRDYYGRFCVSWDSGATPQTRLKDWLDPGNTGGLTNDGYDPYPVNNSLNLALLNIISPSGVSCQTNTVPSISVENTGTDTITSFIVHYRRNSSPDTTFIWTGSLASFDTTVVTLPSYTANIGQDTIYFSVTAPNDSTQIQLSNNADSTTFIVFPATGTGAPLKQGFEAGGFPPAGWSVTTPVSGYTWVKSAVGSFGQSQYSAMVDEFSPSSSTAGETPSLISPAIDMSHAPSPSYVKFDVAYSVSNAGYDDSLAVLVSTDCGASWNTIYQRGGDDLATAPGANASFTPTSTQWRTDSVNISDLIGHAAVIFKFEVISGWGNTMFLDNIDIADTLGITAISPVSNQLSVHVFPNPFTETLRLQFTLDATQNMDAAVYSVDGKKLIPVLNAEKENAGTHQVEINTQELSNGIYILKVNQQFFKIEKLK